MIDYLRTLRGSCVPAPFAVTSQNKQWLFISHLNRHSPEQMFQFTLPLSLGGASLGKREGKYLASLSSCPSLFSC